MLVTIHPSAAGTYSQWAATGYANAWECIYNDNDDTDYLRSDAVGEFHTLNYENPSYASHPLGGTRFIVSVTNKTKLRKDCSPGLAVGFVRGIRYLTTNFMKTAEAVASTSYYTESDEYLVSPFSSTIWTETEINGLEGGIGHDAGASRGILWTYSEMDIVYGYSNLQVAVDAYFYSIAEPAGGTVIPVFMSNYARHRK